MTTLPTVYKTGLVPVSFGYSEDHGVLLVVTEDGSLWVFTEKSTEVALADFQWKKENHEHKPMQKLQS